MDRIQELRIDSNTETFEYRPPLVSSLSILYYQLERNCFICCLTWQTGMFLSLRGIPERTHSVTDWLMTSNCMLQNSILSRLLLQNGKRWEDYLDSSRQSKIAANSQQEPPPMASLPSHPSTSDALWTVVPTSVSDTASLFVSPLWWKRWICKWCWKFNKRCLLLTCNNK